MIEVKVTPDQATLELISALEMVSTKKLPNTVRAIKAVVATLEYTWKSYAMGAAIPGTSIRIKSVNPLYVKSIKSKSSGLSGLVYSDSPVADSIEEGTEQKDLKKIIPFGPKGRVGKNGPYNIIPLRHGTPTALNAPMPEVVYKEIRRLIKQSELEKSRVLKRTVTSPNIHGQQVRRRTYKWGGAYKNPTFPNFQGLVVFDTSAGSSKARSQYLTFRVVSANKPKVSKAKKGWEGSWVVPSREGLHLTRHVIANTKEIISDTVRAGLSQDLL